MQVAWGCLLRIDEVRFTPHTRSKRDSDSCWACLRLLELETWLVIQSDTILAFPVLEGNADVPLNKEVPHEIDGCDSELHVPGVTASSTWSCMCESYLQGYWLSETEVKPQRAGSSWSVLNEQGSRAMNVKSCYLGMCKLDCLAMDCGLTMAVEAAVRKKDIHKTCKLWTCSRSQDSRRVVRNWDHGHGSQCCSGWWGLRQWRPTWGLSRLSFKQLKQLKQLWMWEEQFFALIGLLSIVCLSVPSPKYTKYVMWLAAMSASKQNHQRMH